MSDRRAVTLRLPAEDFARLEAEAKRAGVRPGTLARMLLHGCLKGPAQRPRAALERLEALRAEMPRIDAVEIVRAGRDDLHTEGMPVQITIRNVPDEVRAELAARAALRHMSMQEYLRRELGRLAARPTIDSWLAEVRRRKAAAGTRLPSEEILEHRNADRR